VVPESKGKPGGTCPTFITRDKRKEGTEREEKASVTLRWNKVLNREMGQDKKNIRLQKDWTGKIPCTRGRMYRISLLKECWGKVQRVPPARGESGNGKRISRKCKPGIRPEGELKVSKKVRRVSKKGLSGRKKPERKSGTAWSNDERKFTNHNLIGGRRIPSPDGKKTEGRKQQKGLRN